MDLQEVIKTEEKLAVSGNVIERTARCMKQALQKRLAEERAGITADQWILLDLLSAEAPLSQYEIAAKSYKDAPTITRMLELMANKGLIRRMVDKEDRRRVNIELTAKGHKKHSETLPIIRDIRATGYENLSDSDLNELKRIMDTIYRNFEHHKNGKHALL